jgi:cobalt-zinc-cadmium efflux system outer membrane protein
MTRLGALPALLLWAAPAMAQTTASATTTDRPHVLTLAGALQEALALDPSVRADAETIQQAHADVITASRPPNPTLTASKTLIPLGTEFTPQVQGGPPQLDLGLGYPLDWLLFGKRGAAVASAQLGLQGAQAAHEDFKRRKTSDVAAAFVDVLEAKDLLELAQQDAQDLERVQSIAQQRVSIGGAAPVEVDRSAVAALEARRELRRREAALRVARATLAALLGRSGADADFEVEGSLDVATPAALPDSGALAVEAEGARPDIRVSRLAVDRAAADVHLARRVALPELTPRIGYTRQYQESLGYPDVSSYGVGVDVTLPLFDRNQGNISRALSVQSQRQLELRAALGGLRAEIVQAASDYDVARQAVLNEDRAQLEAARRVRERVQAAYEIGGRPLLEALDAHRVFREASRQSVSGRAAFLRALYRLNAAVGREVVP